MPRKLTLLFASTLTIMSAAIIAPSLPQMAAVFKAIQNAEFLTKLVLTLPTLFIAISAPFAGKFIDRHGRIKLLLIGLVAYAITGVSGYFLNGLYLILAGRAFLGITIGILMTVTTTLVGDYFIGEERKKFVGWQVSFISFGGMIFLLMGGFMADISWRTPFLIYGLSLLLLPFVWAFLKEPDSQDQPQDQSNQAESYNHFYLLFGATFIVWVMFFMIPVQLPFLMTSLGIERNMLIGAAVATNTGFGALAALGYSRIKRYLSFSSIFSVGLFILAVGYFQISRAGTFGGIQLGMAITGIGMGLIIPNTNLWLIQRTPESIRGREIGLLTTFRFLGQFFSPVAVQPIAANFGLSKSFLFASFFIIILSIFFMIYKPTKPHGKYSLA